jgi:hypothetical protein
MLGYRANKRKNNAENVSMPTGKNCSAIENCSIKDPCVPKKASNNYNPANYTLSGIMGLFN